MEFKKYLKPHLADVEGFSEKPYTDSRGILSVGHGVNLTSPDNLDYLKAANLDPEKVKTQGLTKEEADRVKDIIIDGEHKKLMNRYPEIMSDLSPQEEATITSLFYNSPELVGPNLRGYLANKDKLSAAKEILFRSNKNKELGVAFRRLKEAELFGANLNDVIKTADPAELQQLKDIINNSDNENVKRDIINKYGEVLGLKPKPIKFNKLNLSN